VSGFISAETAQVFGALSFYYDSTYLHNLVSLQPLLQQELIQIHIVCLGAKLGIHSLPFLATPPALLSLVVKRLSHSSYGFPNEV